MDDAEFLISKKYELTLVASDGRNENFTKVVIHINDVNDLPPSFSLNMYACTINEEMPGPYPYNLIQV